LLSWQNAILAKTQKSAKSGVIMKESRDGFKLLLLASVASFIVASLPYGDILTYPFRLFVTYVHETGHALANILTLGHVTGMVVNPDGSGTTYSVGGIRIITSSAGYLGSTLFGALLLLLCRQVNNAPKILTGLALGVLSVTLIFIGFGYLPLLLSLMLGAMALLWWLRPQMTLRTKSILSYSALLTFCGLIGVLAVTNSLFAWIAGLVLTIGLFAAATLLPLKAAHFLLSFLAVQCCLNALSDLQHLVFLSLNTNTATDAGNMERYTGIPAIFWAVIWGLSSLVILSITLWSYRRSLVKTVTDPLSQLGKLTAR
jgi:hypothetical protein